MHPCCPLLPFTLPPPPVSFAGEVYMIACYVGTNFPKDYFVTYPKDYIHPYLGVHGGTHTPGMQAFACVLPLLAWAQSPLALAPG